MLVWLACGLPGGVDAGESMSRTWATRPLLVLRTRPVPMCGGLTLPSRLPTEGGPRPLPPRPATSPGGDSGSRDSAPIAAAGGGGLAGAAWPLGREWGSATVCTTCCAALDPVLLL